MPWTAAGGGLLIGLAAAVLVLFNGRIAGISGILGGLFRAQRGDAAWRVAFLAGLVAAPVLYGLFAVLPSPTIDASESTLVVAGLLVGIGSRYGGGCTSGHGVCGISRLSPRSLIATATFMAAGFVIVYLVRHALV
jgi:hypothetical protein